LISGATGAVGDTGWTGVQGDIGLLRFGMFSCHLMQYASPNNLLN